MNFVVKYICLLGQLSHKHAVLLSKKFRTCKQGQRYTSGSLWRKERRDMKVENWHGNTMNHFWFHKISSFLLNTIFSGRENLSFSGSQCVSIGPRRDLNRQHWSEMCKFRLNHEKLDDFGWSKVVCWGWVRTGRTDHSKNYKNKGN